MADTEVRIDSPQIQIDAPVELGFKSLSEDIVNRVRDTVDKVKSGDDEIMAVIFLGLMFVVAGVFVWRRL